MKTKVYLRVAKNPTGRTPFKIDASAKPNYRPLTANYGEAVLPTLAFAIELDIPPEAFKRAETVIAEIAVPLDIPVIAAEVAAP